MTDNVGEVSDAAVTFAKDIEDQEQATEKHDVEISSDSEDDPDKDDDDESQVQLPRCLQFLKGTKGWGWIVCGLLLAAYSIAAFVLDFQRARLLFVVEALVVGLALLRYVILRALGPENAETLNDRVVVFFRKDLEESKLAGGLVVVAMAITIGIVTRKHPENLISALGLLILIGLSWAMSYHRTKVRWRPVLSGIFLQFVLGLLILRVEVVAMAFEWLGDQVSIFLAYSNAGASFVYGHLADATLLQTPLATADGGEYYLYPPFYFNVLSLIFFFSSVVSLLSYCGVIQYLVDRIGRAFAILMGTSGPETFNSVANIFLSMTESPLLIRPFLSQATDSELHAIMTAGFASVAGSVLGAYISFGASARDLLVASLLSAPACLAISKLILPETINLQRQSVALSKSEDPNLVAAISNGASLAVGIVLEIGGQLIAIISVVAMLDGFLAGIGGLIDIPNLSFDLICSYVFYPVAWIIGVPTVDCFQVASLIGTKIIVNEFAAYAKLGVLIREGVLSGRSVTIATYALCGFSNLGSIGITLGVVTSLTSAEKKPVITRLVGTAMIGGNIACFMTACIAGLFIPP